MASTRDIRQRIRGVKNIQQITRAMDMIASARLQRVQERALEGRPFAERLAEIVADVVPAAGTVSHPMMQRRALRTAGVLAVTADRGLCGGYSANVISAAEEVRRDREAEGADVRLYLVGRKGIDYARRRNIAVEGAFAQPGIQFPREEVRPIVDRVVSDYTRETVDRVDLVYTAFESMARHAPQTLELLPITPPAGGGSGRSYRFEPGAADLLGHLLPLYIELSVYRALVESMAAEQAARMIAMHGATESANEMIQDLSKKYNRARQSSITTEILEVVAGAEAILHDRKT